MEPFLDEGIMFAVLQSDNTADPHIPFKPGRSLFVFPKTLGSELSCAFLSNVSVSPSILLVPALWVLPLYTLANSVPFLLFLNANLSQNLSVLGP